MKYSENGIHVPKTGGYIFFQTVNGQNVYRLQLDNYGALRMYTSTDGGDTFVSRDI